MKKRSQIICCCEEAHIKCDRVCPKGIAIKPHKVFFVPGWRKEPLKF